MEPASTRATSRTDEKDGDNCPSTGQKSSNNEVVVPQVQDGQPGDSDGMGAARDRSNTIASSHLHGLPLFLVTFLNAAMLFLVQTEIFIVTTSLVAITEELGDFDAASWVLASYFLGYVST